MKKLTLLIAAGAGYVLGTRAGRERYEQIKKLTNKIKNDPRVQEKAHQATDLAKEKAPVVAEKVSDAASSAASAAGSAASSAAGAAGSAASSAKGKVSGSGKSAKEDDLKAKLNPDSTALQDDSGPKGDLP